MVDSATARLEKESGLKEICDGMPKVKESSSRCVAPGTLPDCLLKTNIQRIRTNSADCRGSASGPGLSTTPSDLTRYEALQVMNNKGSLIHTEG